MTDKIAIMNRARKKYRLEHETRVREQAIASFEQYRNDPLFVAGIMLYWAEGKTTDREPYNLELSNSDPNLLKLYYGFLRRYFNINNSLLKVRLFLYPDLDEEKIKSFWSNLLDIPLNQFIKSYIANSRSSVTKNKLSYGTCSIYIANKDLRIIMGIWIDRMSNAMRG